MSVALPALIGDIANRIGAELIGKVMGDKFGQLGGQLIESVIAEIAGKIGVAPSEVPNAKVPQIEAAVRDVEKDMPELLALWTRGLEGQFNLLEAEQRQGGWQNNWRPGWMYLLAVIWTVRLLVVPFLDSTGETKMAEQMPTEIMLTLTGWFLGLYMGGHTIKAIGQNAIDAVRAWREGASK
jgi:hypothetical protein